MPKRPSLLLKTTSIDDVTKLCFLTATLFRVNLIACFQRLWFSERLVWQFCGSNRSPVYTRMRSGSQWCSAHPATFSLLRWTHWPYRKCRFCWYHPSCCLPECWSVLNCSADARFNNFGYLFCCSRSSRGKWPCLDWWLSSARSCLSAVIFGELWCHYLSWFSEVLKRLRWCGVPGLSHRLNQRQERPWRHSWGWVQGLALDPRSEHSRLGSGWRHAPWYNRSTQWCSQFRWRPTCPTSQGNRERNHQRTATCHSYQTGSCFRRTSGLYQWGFALQQSFFGLGSGVVCCPSGG